jgi:hypothetical protein
VELALDRYVTETPPGHGVVTFVHGSGKDPAEPFVGLAGLAQYVTD